MPAPLFTAHEKDQVVRDFIRIMAGKEQRMAAITILHSMKVAKRSMAEAHRTLKTIIMLANASTRRELHKVPLPPPPSPLPRGQRPPRLQIIDGDKPDKGPTLRLKPRDKK